MDVKFQKGFAGRIGKVFHRTSCWNLDPAAPCRWLHWESLERDIENNVCLAAECNHICPGFRKWLYEGNPVRHTVRRLAQVKARCNNQLYPLSLSELSFPLVTGLERRLDRVAEGRTPTWDLVRDEVSSDMVPPVARVDR